MAEELLGIGGGILGLLDLIGEAARRQAVEYELIRLNLRLRDVGSEQLNWRDLLVLVRRWQQEPHNAVAEAVQKHSVWTIGEQLLAFIYDTLQMANWQRLKRRHAPKPKPLPRPWDKSKTRQLGRDPIPISQFNDWWEEQSRGR